MTNAGGTCAMHIRNTSFMGFVEVVKNLRTIGKLFRLAKQQIKDFQPDEIILIDYPGFNLRMAKWAKTAQFVCYLLHRSPSLGMERKSGKKAKAIHRQTYCYSTL